MIDDELPVTGGLPAGDFDVRALIRPAFYASLRRVGHSL
jgi:hypothetical protein